MKGILDFFVIVQELVVPSFIGGALRSGKPERYKGQNDLSRLPQGGCQIPVWFQLLSVRFLNLMSGFAFRMARKIF